MEDLILRSTSAAALQAELRRSDLLREAAANRRFRAVSAGSPSIVTTGPGIVGRFRTAFAGLGLARPTQADCADCV